MSAFLHLSTDTAPGSPCPHILRAHDATGSIILAACATEHVRQVLVDGLERRGVVSVDRRPGDGTLLPSNNDGRRVAYVADAVWVAP